MSAGDSAVTIGVWALMLFSTLIVPVLIICFGNLLYKKPPKKINGMYGYRTARSMKTAETWEFANRGIGRLWRTAGLAMLIPTATVMLFCLERPENVAGVCTLALVLIQTTVLCVTIVMVEKALGRTFDENGVRKTQNSGQG